MRIFSIKEKIDLSGIANVNKIITSYISNNGSKMRVSKIIDSGSIDHSFNKMDDSWDISFKVKQRNR